MVMPEKKSISVVNCFNERSADFEQVFTQAFLNFPKSEVKQKQIVVKHKEDKTNV